MARLAGDLHHLARLSSGERGDLARAFGYLLKARYLFGRSNAQALVGPGKTVALGNGGGVRAQEIAVAIRRSAERMPIRSDCLIQALAGRLWLDCEGIRSTIRVGVARNADGTPLEAHAWLECDGIVVIGGDVARYSPLG